MKLETNSSWWTVNLFENFGILKSVNMNTCWKMGSKS